MSAKLNTVRHYTHCLPKHPTLDERVAWHLRHTRNCQCRPLGGKILQEINKGD
ncbi:MAG: hypothetical protein V1778_00225 [bacterium]